MAGEVVMRHRSWGTDEGHFDELSWDWLFDTIPIQIGPTCTAHGITVPVEERYKIAFWRSGLPVPFRRLSAQYVLDRGNEIADGLGVQPDKYHYFAAALSGILPVEHYNAYGVRGEDNWMPETFLNPNRTPRYWVKQAVLTPVYGRNNMHIKIVNALNDGPIYCDFLVPKNYRNMRGAIPHESVTDPYPWMMTPEQINRAESHAAPIVGLGIFTPISGLPIEYYQYQNSFGRNWGDHGYGRIVRKVISSAWVPMVGSVPLTHRPIDSGPSAPSEVAGSSALSESQ